MYCIIKHVQSFVNCDHHTQICRLYAGFMQLLTLLGKQFTDFVVTSSNGNIFRITGPLWVEFTGHRWIPPTKASDAELDVFFIVHLNKRLNKQSRRRWFGTPSRSLWRHCNMSNTCITVFQELSNLAFLEGNIGYIIWPRDTNPALWLVDCPIVDHTYT